MPAATRGGSTCRSTARPCRASATGHHRSDHRRGRQPQRARERARTESLANYSDLGQCAEATPWPCQRGQPPHRPRRLHDHHRPRGGGRPMGVHRDQHSGHGDPDRGQACRQTTAAARRLVNGRWPSPAAVRASVLSWLQFGDRRDAQCERRVFRREIGPRGYTASSTAGCASVAGLAPGASATCTLTNDDRPIVLTVIKHVINDSGGGTATAANFTMTVSAPRSPGPARPTHDVAGAETPARACRCGLAPTP